MADTPFDTEAILAGVEEFLADQPADPPPPDPAALRAHLIQALSTDFAEQLARMEAEAAESAAELRDLYEMTAPLPQEHPNCRCAIQPLEPPAQPCPPDVRLTWLNRRELHRIYERQEVAPHVSALERIVIALLVLIVAGAIMALATDALFWKIAVVSTGSVEFLLFPAMLGSEQQRTEAGKTWSANDMPAGLCSPSRIAYTGRTQGQ